MSRAAAAIIRAAVEDSQRGGSTHPEDVTQRVLAALDDAGWTITPAADQQTA